MDISTSLKEPGLILFRFFSKLLKMYYLEDFTENTNSIVNMQYTDCNKKTLYSENCLKELKNELVQFRAFSPIVHSSRQSFSMFSVHTNGENWTK